jgi:DNA-binding response OmpR family regulator
MTKVLIVEDEIQIAKMYQFKLETNGFSVQCAFNGRDGLEVAEKFRPDLILLDLMMPIMDGAEMLKQLRGKKWGANVKVIVLTNISRDEAPSDMRLLGVDRYIVKAHYTPSQVFDIVNSVLGLKPETGR